MKDSQNPENLRYLMLGCRYIEEIWMRRKISSLPDKSGRMPSDMQFIEAKVFACFVCLSRSGLQMHTIENIHLVLRLECLTISLAYCVLLLCFPGASAKQSL